MSHGIKKSMLKIKRLIHLNKGVRKWALGASLFAGLAGLYSVGMYFFPLEASQLSDRIEYWRKGVRTVQVDGLQGYLQETTCPGGGRLSGQGCACVALIHGLGDDAKTWKKLLLWPEENWRKMGLNEPFRLFAMDLPGSGQTPPPQDPTQYRVRLQAQNLQKVLKSMCSEWVVVGNSLGGWIGAWLALEWPEGVSRLILLDSAGLTLKSPDESKNAQLLLEPSVESLKEFQKRAYFHPRTLPERVWKMIAERAKQNHAKEIVDMQIEDDGLKLRLPTLHRPTLLLWGQEDHVIPLSIGKQMRDLMPSSIWREVPQCGHLPQKECPIPVIQAIIDMIHFGAM